MEVKTVRGYFYCLFAGNSVLMRSEQNAFASADGGTVSIDMDSVQIDQHDQMQILEQQVGE